MSWVGSANADQDDLSLGLGPHLVGKSISMNGRRLLISKELGEGGFSFVYLVKSTCSGSPTVDEDDVSGTRDASSSGNGAATPRSRTSEHTSRTGGGGTTGGPSTMVLKITSVHTSSQRQMAIKEARLLQKLSHPSIVTVYGHGFRGGDEGSAVSSSAQSTGQQSTSTGHNSLRSSPKSTVQHLILMEYCEGGTAFDAIQRMKLATPPASLVSPGSSASLVGRFDLPSLVISFGQICNAVSYLHAQHPPIIHRDLKPVNFLIKNGSYKLCDFGSAIVGHVDLRTPEQRRAAEEAINKTTTQMFRSPEMVDLYMARRLTEATDVWALGCCLYSLAFLRDCFEEGSNLAILSRKYRIPDDNPYGPGVSDLIDRMLAGDYKERADMSEVILCLSALYSNRPLPKRKKRSAPPASQVEDQTPDRAPTKRTGAYRTDGQGIRPSSSPSKEKRSVVEKVAKKLNPNSAAAKRKKASENQKKKSLFGGLSGPGSSGGQSVTTPGTSTPSSQMTTPSTDDGFGQVGDSFDFACFDDAFENFDLDNDADN
ncbi:hypothetical protein THAOC_15368 [Thalassiosira oceanica]|uniref:non-specific serine/threonine protein kinase n=1 Tax=Thalassiosira oceanica TaxID=159749 RepID=K0SSA5_THAOC|nr:hypothetical protein THAOC_15368 [Thalassiosira oceanica]|mmetsp:Transcript_30021/g.68547  ORF Transcript_30021/g.68547 Transcript_30021/m.68547 type:complete len:541 (+) Transcript_30021:496-2118(+)|eukprot:EJK63946.1 hypothetical protein THAOC_15368 [Thalassiosira oceanica]